MFISRAACSAFIAFAALAAPAAAQTIGTYSFTFTDTAGTPLNSAVTLAPGQALTVQVRINESGSGTVLSAAGLGGYDSTITTTAAGVVATTNTSFNYLQFNPGVGTASAASATNFSTNGTALSFSRGLFPNNDQNTYIKSTTGSVALYQFSLTGGNAGTTTIRAGNRDGQENFIYSPLPNLVGTYLDSFNNGGTGQALLDLNPATLSITVLPVPEPATVLAASTLGLGAVGAIRRRRARALTPAA